MNTARDQRSLVLSWLTGAVIAIPAITYLYLCLINGHHLAAGILQEIYLEFDSWFFFIHEFKGMNADRHSLG